MNALERGAGRRGRSWRRRPAVRAAAAASRSLFPGLTALLLACGGTDEGSRAPSSAETAETAAAAASGYRDLSRGAQHRTAVDEGYLSPLQMLPSPDGASLYVTCENTDEVLVVDTARGVVTDRIAVGREPFGLLLGPGGDRLYVSHRWDDDIGVIDLATGQVEDRIAVGEDPHQMVLSADGARLYVTNLGTDDVSLVDLASGREIRRLAAGNAPFGIAAAGDGRFFVSSQYSRPVPFREPPELELTVLQRGRVRERRRLHSTVIGQGIAADPAGRFVAVALELPKNLIPQTQVYQGWMVTYGVAVSEMRPGGRSAYLLIDEPQQYFADPYDVVFSADGARLFVSSSGVDAITVIDVQAALETLAWSAGRIGLDEAAIGRLARHLGASAAYVEARIPTGANPKGMALSPDGRWLYVACRLDDEVIVVDTRNLAAARRIDLGGPAEESQLRRGAKLFHYATISFQQQMSCNTCHPENSVDGLTYDIAVDGGMGRNLVDNMTLRGFAETAPFKWSGRNPNLQRQEGPRAAQLFFRTHGFDAAGNEDIVAYLESIPQRPNRHRGAEGLDETQSWGQELFARDHDNMGRYIPVANRCITCHPPPYGTDRRRHDIGARAEHDREGLFDTPHLVNTYERPPYMHDGRAWSLEEIWTLHNPGDTHGVTNDMSKDQLNALIEYIKTL